MQCFEFENRLQQLLDERQPIDDDLRLQQHADVCPACEETLQSWRQIESALQSVNDPVVCESEASRSAAACDVLAQLHLEDPVASTSSINAVMVMAAVLLIMLAWSHRGRSGHVQVNPDASVMTNADESLSIQAARPQNQILHEEQVLGHASTSASLDHDPSRQTAARVDAVREIDPATWWNEMQAANWVDQTMPTVQSVREGVAPIGRTLVRAVTLLTVGGGTRTS